MDLKKNELKFVVDYRNNEKYIDSFCELAKATFGLGEFREWFNKGFCNENYICFSYAYEDKIIANVSVNKFKIIINGKVSKAIQLGTVMTHKDYRNNGLIRSLMNKVFDKYEDKCDLVYLFANDTVLDFYPKFGFKRVYESSFSMDCKQIDFKSLNLKKLDLDINQDKVIVDRLCKNRTFISKRLGFINDEWPLKTYCNYMYKDKLYYIEEAKIIIVLDRKDGVLNIYDILSENEIDLDNIIEKVIRVGDKIIKFNFTPESNKYEIEDGKKCDDGDTLFVKSIKNDLVGNILFPNTSHT